jgi:pilus assembly protein CpaE
MVVAVATTPSETMKMAQEEQPEVVLIDDALGAETALALMQTIADEMPQAAVVAIIPAGKMDYAREAMLAGARAFVPRPFTGADLLSTIRQAHQLEAKRRTQRKAPTAHTDGAAPASGQVIAVYSPKGGVGRTMLSANLGVALRQATGKRVVVVDGHIQFGEVGLALNARSNYTIVDLLTHLEEMDVELMNAVLASHTSGVKALLSSSRIESMSAVPATAFNQIFGVLRDTNDFIVVDTWPVLDENTLSVLEAADRILLVITQDLATLRNAKLFLELGESVFPKHKISIVLNKYSPKGGLAFEAVQQTMGLPIAITLPDDPGLVPFSINRGIPFVMSHSKTVLSRRMTELAQGLQADTLAGTVSDGGSSLTYLNGSDAEPPRSTTTPTGAKQSRPGFMGMLRAKR